MKLIEQINAPADLRRLSLEQLPEVATEIRQYIIETCARIGGGEEPLERRVEGWRRQATYLSSLNLSKAPHWNYSFKILPRPKGRATHVIYTEYDLPQRTRKLSPESWLWATSHRKKATSLTPQALKPMTMLMVLPL